MLTDRNPHIEVRFCLLIRLPTLTFKFTFKKNYLQGLQDVHKCIYLPSFWWCPFPLISSSVFVMSVLIVSRRSSKEIHLQLLLLCSSTRVVLGRRSPQGFFLRTYNAANKLLHKKECENGCWNINTGNMMMFPSSEIRTLKERPWKTGGRRRWMMNFLVGETNDSSPLQNECSLC